MSAAHSLSPVWSLDFAKTLMECIYEANLPLRVDPLYVDGHVIMDVSLSADELPVMADYDCVRLRFHNGADQLQVSLHANDILVRQVTPVLLDPDSGTVAANRLWADLLLGLTAYMSIRRLS